jgi:hypothetical protein
MWKISPNYYNTSFKWPLTTDDKITIFNDRTLGWQLTVAEYLLKNHKHGGFAVLSIVMSYFEMIAKYYDGYAEIGCSESYFKKGVFLVFPEIGKNSQQIMEDFLDRLYKKCRCGMYHNGITGGRIILTGGSGAPMIFDPLKTLLIINPHKLVPVLITHFQDYIKQLRDPSNKRLRENFQKRFDFDSS